MPWGTFSVVAADLAAGEWGGAVASRFLAVGSLVLFARAGVGAVATQSFINTDYGPRGLDLCAKDWTAQRALEALTSADEERGVRQAGIVDRAGTPANFTGSACVPWAGGATGQGFAVQGNMLAGPAVVSAMAEAMTKTSGSLARRMYAALVAGDRAGGDKRGRQAASILVCRDKGGYGGRNDRSLDLRVDDHPDPVTELGRLLDLHDLYLPPEGTLRAVPVDSRQAQQIQAWLSRLGYWQAPPDGQWTDALAARLYDYMFTENLELREQKGPFVDRQVLDYLQRHAEALGDAPKRHAEA